MDKSKVLVLLPLIAALCILSSPIQAKCYQVLTDGPEQCNCTSSPANLTICTSSTITATGSVGGSFQAGGPAFKAGLGGSYSQQLSTGASSCAEQTVQPGDCIFLQYKSRCCIKWKKVKGFFFDTYEPEVTCVYVGYDLKSKEDGCA